MCILSKQFIDQFNKLYTKLVNDNKIDNDEYNELVKVYENIRGIGAATISLIR